MAASTTGTNPLTSPTLSASSYDLVSNSSRSGSMVSRPSRSDSDDSDDEIVWNVSEDYASSAGSSVGDSDFILLSYPASVAMSGLSTPDGDARATHTPLATENLEVQMNALSLAPQRPKRAGKKARKAAAKATATVNPSAPKPQKPKLKKKKAKKNATPVCQPANTGASPTAAPVASPSKQKKQGGPSTALVKHSGLGARPIVDDFSDRQSVVSYDNESVASPTLYEEAATFISSFLSNPDAQNDSVYRLTLMQSIIIELGLATAALPSSLKAAKAFLKSRVFLNIREYIAVREQGPEAVQRAMYPSKTALIKDIRRNPTPLKWVKQHGLQVLLVGWHTRH